MEVSFDNLIFKYHETLINFENFSHREPNKENKDIENEDIDNSATIAFLEEIKEYYQSFGSFVLHLINLPSDIIMIRVQVESVKRRKAEGSPLFRL